MEIIDPFNTDQCCLILLIEVMLKDLFFSIFIKYATYHIVINLRSMASSQNVWVQTHKLISAKPQVKGKAVK